jgi:hypothetical protein
MQRRDLGRSQRKSATARGKRSGPRTSSARVTPDPALLSPAPPAPAHVPEAAPSGPRRGSRLARGLLLTVVPLAVAAVAARWIGTDYSTTARIRCPVPARAGAADAQPIRPLLLDFAWQFASGSENVRDWSLTDAPRDGAFEVMLVAGSRSSAHALADAFRTDLRAHLRDVGSARTTELAAERDAIAQRMQANQAELARVAAALAEAPADDSADSPLARLAAAVAHDQARWSEYVDLRDRLGATRATRDALAAAPPIEKVVVESAARDQARKEHIALQQDLRHLGVQLLQIRRAMLESAKTCQPQLELLLSASQSISEVIDTASVQQVAVSHRPLMEQTAEKASEFHHVATAFAQAWTLDTLRMRDTPPNPQEADLLATYDSLTERIRDFEAFTRNTITTLRRRIRTLQEHPAESGAGYVVDNTMVRGLADMQSAFRAFERNASDLFAADNYLLRAALDSARGLWHRIGKTRAAIDVDLERQAVQQAREARQVRIADLSEEIEQMQARLLERVNAIMHAQVTTSRIARELPDYVATATAGGSARDRQALLAARGAELSEALAAVEKRTASVLDADAVRVDLTQAGALPRNLPIILGAGALGWSATLLGLLGGLRLMGGARSR